MPGSKRRIKLRQKHTRKAVQKIQQKPNANGMLTPLPYFITSSTFGKVCQSVLARRGAYIRTHHSKNIALSIIDGVYAEFYFDKPSVRNAKVIIGIPYELQISAFFTGLGVMALRDKGHLQHRLKGIDKHIPKSFLFWSINFPKWRKLFKTLMDGKQNYVLKPRYLSHSNQGVLVTSSLEDAEKWIIKHAKTYPLWVLQEFVEPLGSLAHYIKLDLFFVYNKMTKQLDYFYSNRLALFSMHTRTTIKHKNPPISFMRGASGAKHDFIDMSTNDLRTLVGDHMTNANTYFNTLFGKSGHFETLVKQQIPHIIRSIKGITPVSSLQMSSKTIVSTHYMSLDLILNSKNVFKILEINVVPCHLKDSEWYSILPDRKRFSKCAITLPDDESFIEYKSQLLDELLHYSLDQYVQTTHKPKHKYLVKV